MAWKDRELVKTLLKLVALVFATVLGLTIAIAILGSMIGLLGRGA